MNYSSSFTTTRTRRVSERRKRKPATPPRRRSDSVHYRRRGTVPLPGRSKTRASSAWRTSRGIARRLSAGIWRERGRESEKWNFAALVTRSHAIRIRSAFVSLVAKRGEPPAAFYRFATSKSSSYARRDSGARAHGPFHSERFIQLDSRLIELFIGCPC